MALSVDNDTPLQARRLLGHITRYTPAIILPAPGVPTYFLSSAPLRGY